MPIIDAEIGEGTKIWQPELVNIYRCEIGRNCNIAAFVEIGDGAIIGNNCRIQAYAFIPQGVIIRDNVFIGPGVKFTNDKYPPTEKDDWESEITIVQSGVSIGAGAIIISGIIIHENAVVAAGAVVTKNIEKGCLVKGVPAK